jgi:DNA repair exonuclease SbcCD ATPase subunit
MLYLKKISLSNWLCYAGENELTLEPKAYAVTARRLDDAERSNFSGKSGLLEAVHFAITGALNKDRHMQADGWLTDGAKKGGVILELSDGSVIDRSRTKSTRVAFTPKGGKTMMKDEAQKAIYDLIGLTAEDIPVTSYFQQRKMARLILAEPAERMDIASAWFRLTSLERAEESLAKSVNDYSSTAADIEGRLTSIRERRKQAGSTDALNETVESCTVQMEDLKQVLEVLQERLAAAERAKGSALVVKEYGTLVDDGNAARQRLDADHGDLIESVARETSDAERKAHEEKAAAAAELRQKRALARGEFDGTCPVAGIACPAKKEINAQTRANAQLLAEAEEDYNTALARADKTELDARAARAALQERERLASKVEFLRERAKKMLPMYEEAMRVEEHGEDTDDLKRKIQNATSEMNAVHSALRQATDALAQSGAEGSMEAKLERDLEMLRKELNARREARTIFGRNGAQRRLAEAALEEIGDQANAMMSACGIDLSLEIQWAREADKLARSCDGCGAAFPDSQKVKACARCGMARGQHLVNKMDILLSEQSGAAEDLTGAAFQLAAAHWLRRDRLSEWAVALIDEPFGQLDAVHRRAFSTYLAAMLGSEFGFKQAFVISHDSNVNATFPGRIEITHDGKRASAKVVA